MSYNFKSLADVELLNSMPENANVIVEVDGATRRAPKEDGIGKLVAVEALEEVPEGATVLAEVNGEIKRVPGEGLGENKTIIFSVIEAADAIDTVTYQTVCNYSPAEVCELMLAGASCVMLMPYAAMSASVSTFGSAGPMPMPTIVSMSSLTSMQMNDGSSRFLFIADDISVQIAYAADGTIENSMFSK